MKLAYAAFACALLLAPNATARPAGKVTDESSSSKSTPFLRNRQLAKPSSSGNGNSNKNTNKNAKGRVKAKGNFGNINIISNNASAQAGAKSVLETQFGPKKGFVNKKSFKSKKNSNTQHIRFGQQIHGFDVEGAALFAHTDDEGNVIFMNGELVSQADVPSDPTIEAGPAMDYALRKLQGIFGTDKEASGITDAKSDTKAALELIQKGNVSFPNIAKAEAEFCSAKIQHDVPLLGNEYAESIIPYAAARISFNNAVNEDVLPKAFFYPSTVDEVVNALNQSITALNDTSGQVCVRACGNSFAGVSSACHDGFVIDLSKLAVSGKAQDIVYEESSGMVTIGASVKQEKVHNFLAHHGRSLPLGAWPGVCVTGFSLGGGFSDISRMKGLACDLLEEVTIVLPGKKNPIKASRKEYEDLFWASCGSGGGIGVVVSLRFQTFPEPQVLSYKGDLSVTKLGPLLAQWNRGWEFSDTGVDKSQMSFSVQLSAWNPEVVTIKGLYYLMDRQNAELAKTALKALIGPFWNNQPSRLDVSNHSLSFSEYSLLDIDVKKRDQRCGFWGRHKSQFFKHFSLKQVETLSKRMKGLEVSPDMAVPRAIINAWGSERIQANEEGSSFWGRNTGYEVNLEVEFDPFHDPFHHRSRSPPFHPRSGSCYNQESPNLDAVCLSGVYFNIKRWSEGWLEAVSSELCHTSGDSLCRFSFINHISEVRRPPESYFGKHLESLVNVKSKYDPSNSIYSMFLPKSNGDQISSQRVATLDQDYQTQLLGYLPLWEELQTEILQNFHIIFLFAATTLQRDDNSTSFSCSKTCTLGFPDSSESTFSEYAKEARAAAKTGVVLSVGGHAMNGCWKYCFGHEKRLAQDIAGMVDSAGLDGVDFNVEEHPDKALFEFLETLVDESYEALTLVNPVKRWILSHSPIAHLMDSIIDSAEERFFHSLDYTHLLRRIDAKGLLSFVFVQYYNSWPVAAIKNNKLFESFVGHTARLQTMFDTSKLVLGMCTGGCQTPSVVVGHEAAAVWHNHRYYASKNGFAGVGIWAITNPGTEAVVDELFRVFREPVTTLKTPMSDEHAIPTASISFPVSGLVMLPIALVIMVVVIGFILIFTSEASGSTWSINSQEKTIAERLPGSIVVFIPMCSESIDEVLRTCANFKQGTLSNEFVRDAAVLYLIVDNDRSCAAVNAVLRIASSVVHNPSNQLDVPYCSGSIHGIPFKLYFKGESRCYKKGKRHSAKLFADLVKEDEGNGHFVKAWAALCLDADVVTFPSSIEKLVVHMMQDESITITCGNLLPSVDQRSLATCIQAAEYFFQNRVTKNAEAALGVVTCAPGAFVLVSFEEYYKTMTSEEFSLPPDSSRCYHWNLVDLGEDRFLTSLQLIENNKVSFMPSAGCTTTVPDDFTSLLKQRRRWFNSSLANDLHLVIRSCDIFRSMGPVGILRFAYLMAFAALRIAGALFSVVFCILLMSQTSSLLHNNFLEDLDSSTSSQLTNYAVMGMLAVWATFLLWSFHCSASEHSVFARYQAKWVQLNLFLSTVWMLSGIVAIAVNGGMQQKFMLAASGMVFVVTYVILILSMAEYRAEFGPYLALSLVAFLIVGIPLLAFLQPLYAMSQYDNFVDWGTRGVSSSRSVMTTSSSNHNSKYRKEKFCTWAAIYLLNIMFASLLLMFGDAMGIALCSCLIAAILIQLVLSLMRNLIMARSRRIGVTKKEEVLGTNDCK